MRRKLGLVILGLLSGGMAVHISHMHRLEQLYRDKERLKVQLFEITENLARIEELWADHQREEISTVDFKIKGENSPFVELELQRQIREITSGLPGTAIGDVRPELLISLLHRRKLTVEQKDYLVTVNWVVLAPGTLFNLSVSPAPGND